MADVQYVTAKVKSITGAHLRDYEFSIEDGTHTVNQEKKIGYKLKRGMDVHVIYPLQYSDDKKWIQVMNEEGGVGFIRANSIDVNEKNVKENTVQTLDKPYRYFFHYDDMVEYETEMGIRTYSEKELDAHNERQMKLFPQIDSYVDKFIEAQKEKGNDVTREMIEDAHLPGDEMNNTVNSHYKDELMSFIKGDLEKHKEKNSDAYMDQYLKQNKGVTKASLKEAIITYDRYFKERVEATDDLTKAKEALADLREKNKASNNKKSEHEEVEENKDPEVKKAEEAVGNAQKKLTEARDKIDNNSDIKHGRAFRNFEQNQIKKITNLVDVYLCANARKKQI